MAQKSITKEHIHLAILESPLDSLVQTLAISKLKQSAEDVDRVLKNILFHPPENRYRDTEAIMNLIYPIFSDNKVPDPNARDTFRKVYKALGGSGDAEYEVQS